jgi:hypothetical protein
MPASPWDLARFCPLKPAKAFCGIPLRAGLVELTLTAPTARVYGGGPDRRQFERRAVMRQTRDAQWFLWISESRARASGHAG